MTSPTSAASPTLVLPRRCQVTLKAHAGPCHVARYDSRGRYLLTAGQDRLIKLWSVASATSSGTDAPAPAPIKTYGSSGAGHSREIFALDVSRDNARFASGGQDNNVLVWDVATGAVLRRFSAHQGRINDVRFAASAAASADAGGETRPANVLLTAGHDATLRFYDLRAQGAYRPMVECRNAQGAIQALAVHDGAGAAAAAAASVWTGSTDGVVRRYDVRMGTLTEDTVDEPITSLSLSTSASTSSSLLLVSHSTTSTSPYPHPRHLLFDTSDGSLLQTFQHVPNRAGEKTARPHACILPHTLGGSHILAGDQVGDLRAWEILSGKEEERVSPSGSPSGSASAPITWTECSPVAAPPGRAVQAVTASADGTVRLWDP